MRRGVVRIFGVILAGGTGQRMGGADKALLMLAGRPLLAHVRDRFNPQVEALALSANGNPARFAEFGLPVLADNQSKGPLSGVLAALQWAMPLGATAVVSVAVDTPFFPGDLVPQLCLAAQGNVSGVAIADSAGRAHPTFAHWPVALAPALAAFLASDALPRLMGFAAANGATRAHFPDDGGFANLNTPQDLANAEARLRGLP